MLFCKETDTMNTFGPLPAEITSACHGPFWALGRLTSLVLHDPALLNFWITQNIMCTH